MRLGGTRRQTTARFDAVTPTESLRLASRASCVWRDEQRPGTDSSGSCGLHSRTQWPHARARHPADRKWRNSVPRVATIPRAAAHITDSSRPRGRVSPRLPAESGARHRGNRRVRTGRLRPDPGVSLLQWRRQDSQETHRPLSRAQPHVPAARTSIHRFLIRHRAARHRAGPLRAASHEAFVLWIRDPCFDSSPAHAEQSCRRNAMLPRHCSSNSSDSPLSTRQVQFGRRAYTFTPTTPYFAATPSLDVPRKQA